MAARMLSSERRFSRDPEVLRIMFEPHAQSPRAIVVVATADDHPFKRDIAAASGHRRAQPSGISGGDISGKVPDDTPAYLDRDRVGIMRVFGLGHENRDDPVANAVPLSPATDRPER